MATRSKLVDFEVLSRLGSGSFGTVYKVRRIVDENLYVIKNVRIIELSFKEQSEAINEVQILAQLKSPYVVRYYDSFIEKDSLHIVMEFCNRGDLQNLIKKAKDKNVAGLKEDVIWSITSQIMLGLHYLHKKNILHRDLKSANVFLTKDETKSHYLVKIGDLGVAKLMDTSTALANTIVGTPYYLSPELCADMPYRDKSDCWALGVLVYECATLQHPFEARNQCALIMKIIEAQVKIPSSTVISTEMRNTILWLLQKDPNARPSIRHILNEQSVREKLRKDQFELPEELRESRITDLLSNPNFEAKAMMKKKGSNLQMLAQRTQEETKAHGPAHGVGTTSSTPTTGTGATANATASGIADPEGLKRQPLVKQRSATGNKEQLVQPQNGTVQRGNTGNVGRVASTRGGASPASGGDSPATIQGNRVRGPASKRRAPSENARNRYQVRPAPSSTTRSNNGESKNDSSDATYTADEHADAKDGSEYEEDFEDYENEEWEEEDQQDAPTAVLSASRPPVGPSGAHTHHEAEDKEHQRGASNGSGSTLKRNGTAKDADDWGQDDKDEFNSAPSRVQSLRRPFAESGDPFHQTDDSVSSLAQMHHMGTLGPDANTWEPVWTQTRGLIDGPSASGSNSARERMESGEVGTTDLGVGLYQEVLEGVQEADEYEETGRTSDLSEAAGSGAEPAMFMIEEARNRAV
eukprot:gene19017-21633_t